ncbi:MAG: hypothetical protein JWP17_2492 [Solirubrobacterales bacterium]|nr:hypothetical protein [Solirubrobacterales bacterium]
MRAVTGQRHLRITDDWIVKDVPSYLAEVPQRRGDRAQIARQYPCAQVTQADDPAAQDHVLGLVGGWPGVTIADTRQTIVNCRAMVLDEHLALGQGEAFITGRELAQVRADGSVHTALAPEWAEPLMQKRWGQVHPLALYGLIPPQSLVFYAPRDEQELRVIERILIAAYSYACGRYVECDL